MISKAMLLVWMLPSWRVESMIFLKWQKKEKKFHKDADVTVANTSAKKAAYNKHIQSIRCFFLMKT